MGVGVFDVVWWLAIVAAARRSGGAGVTGADADIRMETCPRSAAKAMPAACVRVVSFEPLNVMT